MTEPTPPPAPFDAGALARLASEVEDTAYPAVFAARYQQMLPERLSRILQALGRGDLDSTLDAVLSLRVSSTTVGTCELAAVAREIEGDVRRLDVAAARRCAVRLEPAASRAQLALRGYLAAAG